MTDTIFALASAPGRAGIAVMRVSGPLAGSTLRALTGERLPPERRAALRKLRDEGGVALDEALALWFAGPRSFTGEDSIELHLHGGGAVIAAVSARLAELGLRPAEPGEFTRRAFENEKLDLTEAEGLADLIDAETEGQRAQALAQMSGALRRLYEQWRDRLIDILAAIEGEIDFPDEGDVPDALASTAGSGLAALIAELAEHLDDDRRGERVREGFTIALIGEPNAGKSSLLNALTQRDAAIVTEIPGTTRDVVEVRQVRSGFPIILADTAGLRRAVDQVEAEGVRRALARAETADLRLGVVDVSRETLRAVEPHLKTGDALVFNKCDLGTLNDVNWPNYFFVSTKTGDGLAELSDWIDQQVLKRLSVRETPALSRARHRHAVETAHDALVRAQAHLSGQAELAGAEAHIAARALASLTGGVDVEDVLDRVFSQFCIGK
ncbi:MAG: tRNA uridine-5-carboxymethylaminomethyl(34) synthesis GTPase MnmE [Pseudomonadota bacterium]